MKMAEAQKDAREANLTLQWVCEDNRNALCSWEKIAEGGIDCDVGSCPCLGVCARFVCSVGLQESQLGIAER